MVKPVYFLIKLRNEISVKYYLCFFNISRANFWQKSNLHRWVQLGRSKLTRVFLKVDANVDRKCHGYFHREQIQRAADFWNQRIPGHGLKPKNSKYYYLSPWFWNLRIFQISRYNASSDLLSVFCGHEKATNRMRERFQTKKYKILFFIEFHKSNLLLFTRFVAFYVFCCQNLICWKIFLLMKMQQIG